MYVSLCWDFILRGICKGLYHHEEREEHEGRETHAEIFFIESDNPFFVTFVRFVVKSINALIYETLR